MKVYIKYKKSDFYYPPCISYSSITNRTHLSSGILSIEIPNGTELEDIVYDDDPDTSCDDFLYDFFN